MKPELDPKKGNGKKVGRNDPCPCGAEGNIRNATEGEVL
jgi:uncharacterized protein YecA (UPF0149 family)